MGVGVCQGTYLQDSEEIVSALTPQPRMHHPVDMQTVLLFLLPSFIYSKTTLFKLFHYQ